MAGSKVDKFVNVLQQTITMSDANTITFQEINVGLNVFDKVGMLIHRVEVAISTASMNEMIVNGDVFRFSIVTSNLLSSITLEQPAVVDSVNLNVIPHGTPASAELFQNPIILDYNTLPGGGILITPKPLYLALDTSGFSVPGSATVRFMFTIVDLKPEEYFELLEARQFFG